MHGIASPRRYRAVEIRCHLRETTLTTTKTACHMSEQTVGAGRVTPTEAHTAPPTSQDGRMPRSLRNAFVGTKALAGVRSLSTEALSQPSTDPDVESTEGIPSTTLSSRHRRPTSSGLITPPAIDKQVKGEGHRARDPPTAFH